MAITLVSSEFAGSADTNVVTTAAIDTTGATLVVVIASSYEAVSTPVVTDSATNLSWQGLTAVGSAGSAECRIFYHAQPTTSGTHTFTLTTTGGYPAIVVMAFADCDTATPFDLESGASFAAAASIQPGSLTPSDDDYVVINGIAFQSTNTMDLPGHTIAEQRDFESGLAFGVAGAYLIQTSTAASNPTWGFTNATGGCVQASFKFAAGAPPPAATNRYLALLGVG